MTISVGIRIDEPRLRRFKAAIEGTTRQLRKELRIAVDTTAKRGLSISAKEIAKELKMPQKDIKAALKVVRGSADDLTATIELRKDSRINLRSFGARQTKKGISYRISRSGKDKGFVPSAFQIHKFGKRVFKRLFKARKPIIQLFGPSPWGVFLKGKKIQPARDAVEVELKKQVDKRIRFITLKKTGVI